MRIVLLLALLLAPTVTSSSEFQQTVWLQQKIAKFFVNKQVADPYNRAAVIVSCSQYPVVAAAQAVIESQVKPAAVGRHHERGCYQVRERYWGKVSPRFDRQTQQHSVILTALLEENNHQLKRALRRYNGSGLRAVRYERRVARAIAEILEV